MLSSRKLHIILLLLAQVLLVSCAGKADHTVCFFGSSVCKGAGAEIGYAEQVGNALPHGWHYVNISVGGNNTYDLFARYDRDLMPTEAKYVVIGLSLGNEGLHEKGDRALLSYRENMPRLIRQLQQDGRTVIVTNNYPRADFNSVDYRDLCEVNLEVQQWDVTTINLFGTIDPGLGWFESLYWDSPDCLSQLGHDAFASAFAPSLFKALDAGKPLPEYVATAGDENGVDSLYFMPEAGVQSYTLSYQSHDTTYTTTFSVCPSYTNTQSTMRQYVNGLCMEHADGCTPKLDTMFVSGYNIHQLFFYRAALTPLEVQALAQGRLLRSSLEIYCPLLQGNTHNYAQSLNTISINK